MFPKANEEIIESIDEFFDMCFHAVNGNKKAYTPGQLKKYNEILDNKDKITLNYRLMQLNDVEISLQSKDLIRTVINTSANSFNKIALRTMFKEDGLYSHLHKFSDWSRTFTKMHLYGGK